MIKSFIQKSLSKLGYRLVPIDRDAQRVLQCIPFEEIEMVFDIGANVGNTVSSFLKDCPSAKIFAFEPNPESFELLKQSTQSNTERVSSHEIALSDTTGETTFFFPSLKDSTSSLLAPSDFAKDKLTFFSDVQEKRVTVKRLDDFSQEIGLEITKPALAKLDVQGAELMVIKGGYETFKQIDHVICELSLPPLYDGQADHIELFTIMKELGFSFLGFSEQFQTSNLPPLYCDLIFSRTR